MTRSPRPAARRRSRAAVTGVLASALVLLLSSCQMNAGTEFASQFGRYLDGRDDVASHRIRGNNDLPGRGSADSRVDLRDGLSDAELARSISEITHHRVARKIAHHNLSFYFPAVNGSGAPATVSVFVRTGDGALGDTSPAALERRIAEVRAFAASDPGLITLDTFIHDLRGSTTGDPYVTADRLNDYLRTDPPGVRYVSATSGDVGALGVVSFDAGDSVEQLRPLRQVLAALPPGVTPVRWRANSQRPVTAPQFELVLPRGTDPAVLEAAEHRAAEAGIPLSASIAR